MIALILVSHSAKIAAGTADLIREMAPDCRLQLAAGVDDPEHPIGTDAIAILNALEAERDAAGIVLLVDLGSAILSAQTALELADPDIAAKSRIAAAPLVEGALAAAMAASSGDMQQVIVEAENALAAKQRALGIAAPSAAPASPQQGLHRHARITLAHGIHARPAACLVAALRGLNADCTLHYQGQHANARSLNSLIALAIPHGADVTLYADGPDAQAALAAFDALVAQQFGEA